MNLVTTFQPEAGPPCGYCGGQTYLVHHRVIYGRIKGRWPWVYLCTPCEAHVGCHPGTFNALGTPANNDLRKLRQYVHSLIANRSAQGASRREAYRLLALQLSIEVNECHVALFDETACRRAILALGGNPPSAEKIAPTLPKTAQISLL